MYQTFKQWMTDRFSHNQLADMVNHGVSGGFSGLFYSSETAALYQQYKDEIWKMLKHDAEGYGDAPLGVISNLSGASDIVLAVQFENLLIWYAAERIADDLTSGRYRARDKFYL